MNERKNIIPTPSIYTPIPSFVLKNHIEQEMSKNAECAITCMPLKDCNKLSILSCFHIYQTEAIHKARELSKACPSCRMSGEIIYEH
jgi:hypothetical protein